MMFSQQSQTQTQTQGQSQSQSQTQPMTPKHVVLVQGASGQIGFPVVAQLLRQTNRDYLVRAGVIDPNSEKARKLVDLGAHVVLMDSNRPETLAEALRGVSKLLIIPPRLETNTHIATTIIDAAKLVGTVKHIVLISVLGAESETTFFAKQFRPIEKHLETGGIAWTHLRCSFFMDNFWYYADTIRRTGTLPLPLRDGRIPMVSVRDVGEVAGLILSGRTRENPFNRVYELTGPESLRGDDIARVISQVTGNQVRFQSISFEEHKQLLKREAVKKWLIRAMLDLYSMINAGQISDRVTGDVERVLGRRPITFGKFIKHNINAFSASPSSTTTPMTGTTSPITSTGMPRTTIL